MVKKLALICTICYSALGLGQTISPTIPTIYPVKGFISSGFGYRMSPFRHKQAFHEGLDIVAPLNTNIYAPANGKVFCVGRLSGLGNYIILNHGNGVTSRYGHIKNIRVKKGQKVRKGARIASVGMTGRTTGPHLHYEIRIYDELVNPQKFILEEDQRTLLTTTHHK